jgi:arsenical pump membrane protein
VIGHVVSVLVFLMAVTVVAELADSAGVFRAAAALTARLGRGRVPALWLWCVLLATVSTITLSIDTTAVLLTPVMLAMTRRLHLPVLPFAMTTVWLANTASLLLPVSNLTNLLSLHTFGQLGMGTRAYIGLMWPAAIAVVLTTTAVLAVMFGRQLRGRYPHATALEAGPDRVLFWLAVGVCLALIPIFASGVPVTYPTVAAAVVLVIAYARRNRAVLRPGLVPWPLVGLAAALLAAVGVAGRLGLTAALTGALPAGAQPHALIGMGVAAAVSANVADNLPSYFALAPVAGDHPARLAAVLVGTNVAPVVTLWASMANLLWRDRCRRAGLTVSAAGFAWRGAILAPLATAAGLLALVLSQ